MQEEHKFILSYIARSVWNFLKCSPQVASYLRANRPTAPKCRKEQDKATVDLSVLKFKPEQLLKTRGEKVYRPERQ